MNGLTKWVASLAVMAALWLGVPQVAWANSCWSGPVSPLNFGTVGPGGGSAVGSIGVTCQKNWSASPVPTYFRLCMVIPAGAPFNTVNPRGLTNYGSGRVNYDLYSDPAHTMLIGEGLSASVYTTTATLSQAGNARETIVMPVYGKVHPGQAAPAGGYQGQNYARVYWVASTTSMPRVSECAGGSAISGLYHAVSATWQNSCAILAANDLAFGSRDNLASAVQSQTTVSITCPVGTPWQVGLSNGQHFNTTRRMRHGEGLGWIRYHLYRDAARTQAWGNALGSTTQSGTGNGSAQQLIIHGTVPAQTVPAAGSYEDTVVVTLTY